MKSTTRTWIPPVGGDTDEWTMTKKTGKKHSLRLIGLTAAVALAAFAAGCGGNDRGANPSGTLEATDVDLGSTLAGRVAQVRVDEGDRVQAGDTLVVLDTGLIELQRAQAAANRASLEAQRMVAKDGLAQARQNLALADKTLERMETLVKQGNVTQQQLDEARTRRENAALQVASARHQLEAIDAEAKKLDASLAVFDRQIADGSITSPIDGTVLLRVVEPGEVVTPGGATLRLADLGTLELRVYLDVEDVDRVKLGQEVKVLVDALPDKPLNGKVTWVSDEAEFTPKNVQTRKARSQLVYAVKVAVANPEGALHIGMPAEIVLP